MTSIPECQIFFSNSEEHEKINVLSLATPTLTHASVQPQPHYSPCQHILVFPLLLYPFWFRWPSNACSNAPHLHENTMKLRSWGHLSWFCCSCPVAHVEGIPKGYIMAILFFFLFSQHQGVLKAFQIELRKTGGENVLF